MANLRVAFVSDSHLSRTTPEAQSNWEAVLDHLDGDRPDLVIHAGDLTVDGALDERDLADARRQLDRLPVPWRAVPGNHDIGDNPRPGQPEGHAVDDGRRDRWLDIIGPDWWSVRRDGWTIIAIDAQLFGSGLTAEAEQRAWLEAELSAAGAGGRLLFVSHKPLTAPADELASAPPYRFVPEPTRPWLADLLAAARVPMVVSGHVHQFRLLHLDGIWHAWVPTTWAVLPEEVQPTFGAKRGGILAVELDPSGTAEAGLVEPAGLAQLTLLRDVPNPYVH